MKMDLNELILQMTYAAAQVAQNTMPQTQDTPRTEDGKSFQSLMDEKRTEQKPKETETSSKEGTSQSQVQTQAQPQTAVSAPVLQQLAALVTENGAPAVVNTAVTVPGQETAMDAVAAVTLPETTLQETALPTTVLPQTETVAQGAQPTQQPLVQTAEPSGEPTAQPVDSTSIAKTAPQTESQTLPQQEDVQVTVEQNAAPVRQEDQELDETAVQTDGTAQPLFDDTEAMPQRVGDAPVVETESGDVETKLATKLQQALSNGNQRVEIRLTPENLGRVVVEMQKDSAGVLQVVLHTETSQAAKLLSEHSGALGLLLQNTQHTEVRVEVQQPQQDQPSQQQPDQNGSHGRDQQQQQQHRQQTDPERFLQQLRLGLLPTQAL